MRRKVGTSAKFAIVSLLLLAISAGAQEFKIRAKVDLVEVPVTVKSSGEKLLTGLTRDDFTILEDGRPQVISSFTIDPVPLSAAVIVDTGLPAGSLSKIEKTLPALAGAFADVDEIAVYRYDKFVTKVQDFSQDPEAILLAFQKVRDIKPDTNLDTNLPRGPFSNPGPVINGAPVVPPGQIGVVVTSPPKVSKVLHDAIFTAAADLGKRERQRRRMVLVVSDGNTSGSEHSFEETSNALLERGVQVYAVGIDQIAPFKKLSILDDYAKATGGDVFFTDSIRHMESAYSLATEEARNQYVIGYMSNNEMAGEGPVFRDIAVEVKGRDVKALHRKGYYQYP